MTNDNHDMYRRLSGTVRMLASDAAYQGQYLANASAQAKCRVLADDITTEFSCWLRNAKQLLDVGLLADRSLDHLKALNDLIEGVGSDVEHWTAEALATSETWATIRQQAGICLASMDAHLSDGAKSESPK